jgi:hypothetical protein
MAKIQRNFIAGKMNKGVDERLVPNGQYIDAVNVRLGSSESTEIGALENSKGNTRLTSVSYLGQPLSDKARCLGAFEDGANETIYWFIHDSNFGVTSPTGKIDLIVSFNTITNTLVYHVVSVANTSVSPTSNVLNFNDEFLFTGVNLVDGLLFFTDNYNPPRFINVNRKYSNPSGTPLVDGGGNAALLEESLLVIKKPPYSAPGIELAITSGGDENYLEERFICFAYRYEYQDDEYSATSLFSDAAFTQKPFIFSTAAYLNDGAVNRFNTAIITYNSGGPLVTAIQLLFKDSDGIIIKVIEKLNKSNLGLANNTNYTYTFRNSKIFTILPEGELLRLYDNVPLLAKAQTLMGNRLMYGNYIENYNLLDINDSPVRFEFETKLITELIGFKELEGSKDNVSYNFGSAVTVTDAQLVFDLTDIELKAGSLISIDGSFSHSSFAVNTPSEQTQETEAVFGYTLNQDFSSVYELATSVDFQEKIGIGNPGGNIKPIYDSDPLEETSCDGATFTDVVNCNIPTTLDSNEPTTWTKFESGISAANQSIRIITSPGSNKIGLEIVAVRRVDDVAAPTQSAYEYFKWNIVEVTFQEISDTKSLHSNRDYETAILYMDDFNRSTTALVSPNNSEHIPCGDSDKKNNIQVTIPTTQKPPFWATKYKFAIKPSAETYDTIYTNIFFADTLTNDTYFLLEGENQRKVETGDRYIVKADTSGPLLRCAYATVLEKEAKEADFLDNPPTVGDPPVDIKLPTGTYMKMQAQDFSTALGEKPVISPGKQNRTVKKGGDFPILGYTGFGDREDSGSFTNYDIPAGSRITIDFDFSRRGTGGGNKKCEKRIYRLDATLTASRDYDNIIDWFNGDNAQAILNTGQADIGDGGTVDNIYIPTTADENSPGGEASYGITPDLGINYYRWYQNTVTGEIRFAASGTVSCNGSGRKRHSAVVMTWTIFRAENTLVFETEPSDAQPDVWYEGSQVFDIVKEGCLFDLTVDAAEPVAIAFEYTLQGVQEQVVVNPGESIQNINGDCGSMATSASTPPNNPSNVTITSTAVENVHLGNIQSQTATQPAIIDTSFFNCFAFGNGVESYKIRDSLIGKPLLLGNRVTTTSSEDYRQANRFADITYSGIYNDESNVNKLNEFNLGLLNFKRTEESFGPIQKIMGRSTDVLTLQEDKISYVLAGKNLLSDAAVGGAITSVPEVLGTQIARLEEYGISFNPESFAVYGYDKYFTDQKRGALIQLKGSSYSNEQLTVISEAGMRSWFRDRFIEAPNKQKLGGYDPYMNEFVLGLNDRDLPLEDVCTDCGVTQFFIHKENSKGKLFCFDVGQLVGDVLIDINLSNFAGGQFNVAVTYGALTSFVPLINGANTITVNKNQVLVDKVEIFFQGGNNNAEVDFTVNCPDADDIQIFQICVSDNASAGEFIHNEYRWVDGDFISPLHQDQVELQTSNIAPIVSQYAFVLGEQGAGIIPADGASVSIISNKIAPTDTFVFETPPMNFKYLRTSTLYANTPASIQNLITAATSAGAVDSSGSPSKYLSTFTMPSGGNGDYLYLIYDYRNPVLASLCYSNVNNTDACCGCN